jgi:hypothetical protein
LLSTTTHRCKERTAISFQSVGLEVEPGLSGLDFQAKLTKTNIHITIIFVIGHGDIPMTIRGEGRSGRFPDQTVFAISKCRKPRWWRSNGIANGAKPTRSLRTCNPF